MNSTTPLIWLIIGDKVGDNAQIEIIANELRFSYKVKRVIPKPEFVLGKPRYKISLTHLDLSQSDKLEPPWPDIILTVGRRPSMAALWVQEQSSKPCKIILLGRPKRWEDRFSLIIIPPQYLMPSSQKTVKLNLPLMRVDQDKILEAKEKWKSSFSKLPRPLTAILIGGQTKPFRFDISVARALLDGVNENYSEGSLYITTSRRTPETIINFIKDNLPINARLHCWKQNDINNPYTGLLALADRFIVTGDSVSMMVEVARNGSPLSIFELPYQSNITSRVQCLMTKCANPEFKYHGIFKILQHYLHRVGLLRYPRDLTAIHKTLYKQHIAVPFNSPFNTRYTDIDDGMQKAIIAIRRKVFNLIDI